MTQSIFEQHDILDQLFLELKRIYLTGHEPRFDKLHQIAPTLTYPEYELVIERFVDYVRNHEWQQLKDHESKLKAAHPAWPQDLTADAMSFEQDFMRSLCRFIQERESKLTKAVDERLSELERKNQELQQQLKESNALKLKQQDELKYYHAALERLKEGYASQREVIRQAQVESSALSLVEQVLNEQADALSPNLQVLSVQLSPEVKRSVMLLISLARQQAAAAPEPSFPEIEELIGVRTAVPAAAQPKVQPTTQPKEQVKEQSSKEAAPNVEPPAKEQVAPVKEHETPRPVASEPVGSAEVEPDIYQAAFNVIGATCAEFLVSKEDADLTAFDVEEVGAELIVDPVVVKARLSAEQLKRLIIKSMFLGGESLQKKDLVSGDESIIASLSSEQDKIFARAMLTFAQLSAEQDTTIANGDTSEPKKEAEVEEQAKPQFSDATAIAYTIPGQEPEDKAPVHSNPMALVERPVSSATAIVRTPMPPHAPANDEAKDSARVKQDTVKEKDSAAPIHKLDQENADIWAGAEGVIHFGTQAPDPANEQELEEQSAALEAKASDFDAVAQDVNKLAAEIERITDEKLKHEQQQSLFSGSQGPALVNEPSKVTALVQEDDEDLSDFVTGNASPTREATPSDAASSVSQAAGSAAKETPRNAQALAQESAEAQSVVPEKIALGAAELNCLKELSLLLDVKLKQRLLTLEQLLGGGSEESLQISLKDLTHFYQSCLDKLKEQYELSDRLVAALNTRMHQDITDENHLGEKRLKSLGPVNEANVRAALTYALQSLREDAVFSSQTVSNNDENKDQAKPDFNVVDNIYHEASAQELPHQKVFFTPLDEDSAENEDTDEDNAEVAVLKHASFTLVEEEDSPVIRPDVKVLPPQKERIVWPEVPVIPEHAVMTVKAVWPEVQVLPQQKERVAWPEVPVIPEHAVMTAKAVWPAVPVLPQQKERAAWPEVLVIPEHAVMTAKAVWPAVPVLPQQKERVAWPEVPVIPEHAVLPQQKERVAWPEVPVIPEHAVMTVKAVWPDVPVLPQQKERVAWPEVPVIPGHAVMTAKAVWPEVPVIPEHPAVQAKAETVTADDDDESLQVVPASSYVSHSSAQPHLAPKPNIWASSLTNYSFSYNPHDSAALFGSGFSMGYNLGSKH